MAKELPKYKHVKTGKIYYMDLRLGRFRNVENPHDSLPIITHDLMRRLQKRTVRCRVTMPDWGWMA